jgi:HlyD family secretion protein
MTANVRIIVDTRDDVLKVPNAALRFRPAGAPPEPRASGAAEAGVPDQGAKKGAGGQQAGAALRERLTKELDLDAGQQAKVEAILNETRDRIRALDIEDKAARRQQAERLRAESRARIAEILNPEQRKRYEEMNAAARPGAGRGAATGRVWVLGANGRPQAVSVRIGLADGTHSEVVGGELTEGSQVIIGMRADSTARPPQQPKGGPRFF